MAFPFRGFGLPESIGDRTGLVHITMSVASERRYCRCSNGMSDAPNAKRDLLTPCPRGEHTSGIRAEWICTGMPVDRYRCFLSLSASWARGGGSLVELGFVIMDDGMG